MTRLKGDRRTVSVTVDGEEQRGSFADVEDFNWNPDATIDEVDLLGSPFTQYEVQHNGYKFDFSLYKKDSAAIRYYQNLVERLKSGDRPLINVTVITDLGGGVSETLVFLDVALKLDDEKSSRKSFIKNKFSGACGEMQQF
jgi:hypothetical protein